jgi:hypothetical protein
MFWRDRSQSRSARCEPAGAVFDRKAERRSGWTLKRLQELPAAIGYMTARVMECATIAVGIFSVLSIVTRQDLAGSGADTAWLVTAGRSLVALHDWSFLFGPGLFAGVANGLFGGVLRASSARQPSSLLEARGLGPGYFPFFCFFSARFSFRLFCGFFFSGFPPLSLLATTPPASRSLHHPPPERICQASSHLQQWP